MSDNRKKYLLTLTGPSGSGKSEVLSRLLRTGMFERLTSVTTRPMREGEVDGVDYYFIDEETFTNHSEAGEFIQTVSFNGRNYGTLRRELERVNASGKVPVAILEPGGITQFKNYYQDDPNFHIASILINANMEVLIHRYLQRMSPEDVRTNSSYHAKRISGIFTECGAWPIAHPYDMKFSNSSDDTSWLDEIVNRIVNTLKTKGFK